jgi:hypothetical protein
MQTLEPAPKMESQAATLDLLNAGKVRIHSHEEDPRWELALRIASNGSLGRSRLLARFLLFIVDRHIRNRADEITEQQIGMLVFDRPEGYDSNEDNIVRSYARNLRRRIDDYYRGEGKADPLLLEIPRGGYTPSFSPRKLVEESSFPSTERAHTPLGDPPGTSPDFGIPNRRPFTAALFFRSYGPLLTLCFGIALGLTITVIHPLRFLGRASESSAEAISNCLWRQMFDADRDTFIVPSDDGLVIMQRLTERPVPLGSYISGGYRTSKNGRENPDDAEILKLGARRYTSVVDLDFATHLAQLERVNRSRMTIRYARDLRMDDLRTGNAVLIGSVESNPWIQLFVPQMNFRQSINTDPRTPSGLVNTHPHAGERTLYGTEELDHTYGLIAFFPNLTSTGHILIVGGLNTAGTQAATTFLLTPSLIAPTLQRAREPNGQLRSFELLIGADNFSSNASSPQMIAERIETR